MANTKVVVASNGKSYSVVRLRNIVRGIYISKHVKITHFPEIYRHISDKLSFFTIAQLMRAANKEDLRRTIILDPAGSIIVGNLGLLKALSSGKKTIRVVKIPTWQEMEHAYFPTHKVSAYTYIPTQHGARIASSERVIQ